MPEGQAFASVSTKPLPGWTANAEKSKLATPIKSDDGEITEAVQKITWTAAPDAVVKPGEFQEFEVSLGPLPKVDILVFKALQTYSDGQVVRWIEDPPTDGGAEPEHPAPVLKLAKAAATTAPANSGASTAATRASTGSSDGDGLAGAASPRAAPRPARPVAARTTAARSLTLRRNMNRISFRRNEVSSLGGRVVAAGPSRVPAGSTGTDRDDGTTAGRQVACPTRDFPSDVDSSRQRSHVRRMNN